jgi:hypothetical protein
MNAGKKSVDGSIDPFAALSEKEVRILPPDYALRKIIGEDADMKQIFSSENIDKAQQVINEHKASFVEWVMKDMDTLEDCYSKMVSNPALCDSEIHKLARTAFVIKSQAGTFGFDLATLVAKSLDDFCHNDFRPCLDHMTVIRKHIDTLAAIFLRNITGDGGAVGKELYDNLSKLVKKYRGK